MLVMCVWPLIRFIWLLLILAFSSIFAYLISTKLMYLLSYPKNVDLNVEFKHNLEFPSVTICNNNYLRYTVLWHCVVFVRLFFLAFRFYYRATHMQNVHSAVYPMTRFPSVCHKRVFYRNRWMDSAGFRERGYVQVILHYCRENHVSPKTR